MYPLKVLCKQYTNQSLSEILLERISPSLPRLPRGLLPAAGFQAGASGNPIRGDIKERAAVTRVLVAGILAFLLGSDFEGRLLRRLPRQGRLPPSRISHLFPSGALPLKPISIQEATCIPSTSSQSYISLRDPSPCPTPRHPMTETNDKITNPRSTEMFTRTTYALTKSKWERDQGKKRLQSILEDSVQPWRWLTLDPQQSISRPARSLSSSASRLWRSGQPRLGEKAGHKWAQVSKAIPFMPTNSSIMHVGLPSLWGQIRAKFIHPSIRSFFTHPPIQNNFLPGAIQSLGTKLGRPNLHPLVQVYILDGTQTCKSTETYEG